MAVIISLTGVERRALRMRRPCDNVPRFGTGWTATQAAAATGSPGRCFCVDLALVYLAAFGSLAVQLDGLIGSRRDHAGRGVPGADRPRCSDRGPRPIGGCRRSSGSMRPKCTPRGVLGRARAQRGPALRVLARAVRGAPLGCFICRSWWSARCFWAISGTRCSWKPACWRC